MGGHYDDYEEERNRQQMELDYKLYSGFPGEMKEKKFAEFNTGAQKDVKGKPRFDLIPPEAMKALAEVYSLGSTKYEARNWEKGIPFSVALGALKRHLNEFELGHNINTADGNLEHMAHVMWWATAVVTFLRRERVDLNDLPSFKEKEYESK